MGTYDSLHAVVKCPFCKTEYFHVDIQTKSLGRCMKVIRQGVDIREVVSPEFVKANAMIECIDRCDKCSITFNLLAEIRNYVFTTVVWDSSSKIRYDPAETSYAERMGFLSP